MNEKRDFVVGVLVGSAIGAAVALLYAPQPGDVTRDQIKTKAGEAKDRAADLATTAKVKATDLASTAKEKATTVAGTITEKAGTVKDSAAGMVDQVKTTAQDLVSKGRSLVETKKDQVSAAVDAGKQAYQERRSELEAEVSEDVNGAQASLGSAGFTASS